MHHMPFTLPVVCDRIDKVPSSNPSTGLSVSSMASVAFMARRVIAARITFYTVSFKYNVVCLAFCCTELLVTCSQTTTNNNHRAKANSACNANANHTSSNNRTKTLDSLQTHKIN